MKAANQEIIDVLNEVLAGELTSINQYFLHAEICNNWGFRGLGQIMRQHSIEEMKHAEQLMERVLFLEGLPNVQKLNKINIGENVGEIFRSDMALEHEALPVLRKGIALTLDAKDHVTRGLLEEILKSEEEHVDWLEEQQSLIEQMGLENYLMTQVKKA